MRGNRRWKGRNRRWDGSIPARAGEPQSAALGSQLVRVYPRACGGTDIAALNITNSGGLPRACGGTSFRFIDAGANQGLSPRVRGNRDRAEIVANVERSIPARAGEPPANCLIDPSAGVYPRACGGTVLIIRIRARGVGLSPRVRGNRPAGTRVLGAPGSIPARAGEPYHRLPATCTTRVYPRACGGTGLSQPRDCA